MEDDPRTLVLAPFRAVRPTVDGEALARRLSPPYDVVSPADRVRLIAADPDNAVALVLPQAPIGTDPNLAAAGLLNELVATGRSAIDPVPALYVYEMREASGAATRGLVGAIALRDADAGVILPHENVMAGPVAGRLALMIATDANLEPIYLVYTGGGAATDAVESVSESVPIAEATTPDGVTHRLWSIVDPAVLSDIAADLENRQALIADGHHRYATYRELQRIRRSEHGPGPWDRGLTLLVDSTSYGPQVHAIHRVLLTLSYGEALLKLTGKATLTAFPSAEEAQRVADSVDGFAVVLSDGLEWTLVTELRAPERRPLESPEFAELDVVVLHEVLVVRLLGLRDSVDVVGYAHSTDEAIELARRSNGTVVLLRPTPVEAVARVAAAGLKMPRKSTLFTPKPTSGLLIRRFVDEN